MQPIKNFLKYPYDSFPPLSTSLRSTFFPDRSPPLLSLPALSRGRRGHHSPSLSHSSLLFGGSALAQYTPLSLHWALITRDPLEGGEKENFHDRFASSSTGGERRTGNCRWHNDGNVARALLPGGENKSDGEERETLLRTGSVASNRQRQIGHQRLLLINDVQ